MADLLAVKIYEKLQNEMAKKNRFKVYAHKLELYGLCGNCIK